MNTSKKLLALALATALALGATTTTFAAGEDKGGEPTPPGTAAHFDDNDKDDDDKDDDDKDDNDKDDDKGDDDKDDNDKDDDDKDDNDKDDGDKDDDDDDDASAAVSYTDVSDKNWYYDAVDFVTEKKLMDGLTETNFGPSEKMTRQMLAVALYRLAGSPAVTAENPFADVAADAAYRDAVVWAYSAGVVNGVTENTFSPDSTIQRQAIAAMLARYLNADTTGESDLSAFTDADAIQDYAKAAMSWAAKNELLKGDTKGAVDPRGDATRAQVATILERFAPMAEGRAPAAAHTDSPAAPAGADKK